MLVNRINYFFPYEEKVSRWFASDELGQSVHNQIQRGGY
jgi:hypothetical protein